MRSSQKLCMLVFCLAPLVAVNGATYSEDFVQADGAPEGWLITHENATVAGEVLTFSPVTPNAPPEPTAFAGTEGTAIYFDAVKKVSFDIAFPGDTPDWPFDHGGVVLCCQNTNDRWGNTGYLFDYIAGNFRFIKMIDGGHTQIALPGITAYEGRWEVQLDAAELVFLYNGSEQLRIADADYRGGYVGFYSYVNTGQRMTIDNVAIEYERGECPSFVPPQLTTAVGDPGAKVTVRIPSDANVAAPYQVTVRSANPAIVAPTGHTNGSLVVTFPQGGDQVQDVPLTANAVGRTTLSVSVPGHDCSGVLADIVVWPAATYQNDFTQDDGPPEGLVVLTQNVAVEAGQLALSPAGQGEAIGVLGQGGQAIYFDFITHIEFDIAYPGEPAVWPYDHGGVVFCSRRPDAGRYGNPGRCYVIDFIAGEGTPDTGVFRFDKFVDGQEFALASAAVNGTGYEGKWEIDLTPSTVTFTFNGVEQFTHTNTDYRDGYVAFWAWGSPPENKVTFDNVRVDGIVNPCIRMSPAQAFNRPVNARTVFTVDIPFGANAAGDYTVRVTSSQPAVAVPVGSTAGALDLVFQRNGALRQTFEVECLSPGTTELAINDPSSMCDDPRATFTVRPPGVDSFSDSFAQADGLPEKWTIHGAGGWQVAAGKLATSCPPGPECFIWAGKPAMRFEGVESYRFTINLVSGDPDVGRHGGFMFCADDPTNRGATSGYEIDWIDRVGDHGYRLLRSDKGIHTLIAGPTDQTFELGTEWLLEREGDSIVFKVDGTIIFDIVDPTYREGHFGLWSYSNNTVAEFDDVVIGTPAVQGGFVRGDVNADDKVNIADTIALLSHLFAKKPPPSCRDTGDANDDGGLNIADAITILGHLFARTGPLKDPFIRGCGPDPSQDSLECLSYPPCETP